MSKRRDELEEPMHETTWVEIRNKSKQVLIGVTYRQQKGKYAPDYWEKLQVTYDKAVASKIPNILLVGDLNADPGSDRNAAIALSDFISCNNLTQHIEDPTRIANAVASKLDLIMTNLPLLITYPGVGSPVHENDHRTIYGILNMKSIKRGAFKRSMWDFKKANFDGYREALRGTNWDYCLESDDMDTICERWTTMFLDISKNKIPNKMVTVRPQENTWYNNHLRNLRRAKDRKYGYAAKDGTIHNWTRYKTAKNHYFIECA
jgi:hypothetical protein